MDVHVIGPVIRNTEEDHPVELGSDTAILSTVYKALLSDTRFTAHVPVPNAVLDPAPPTILYSGMKDQIAKADRVVWVFHEEPAGAIEAGIAIAAGKPLHILADTNALPRIVKGIPNASISTSVEALSDEIAKPVTKAVPAIAHRSTSME